MFAPAKERGISEKVFKKEIESQIELYMNSIMPIVADNLEEGMPPEMVNIWQAETTFNFSQAEWKKFYERHK